VDDYAYYDGSDGYDRASDVYDDDHRYYTTSFDAEYADDGGLVNGYADDYPKYEPDGGSYYEPYDTAAYYGGTEGRGGTTTDEVDQYHEALPSDVTPRDAVIYDDGYVDRDGVYHHYDDRRYDDDRRYYGNGDVGGGVKYTGSFASDGGESAYDVDELGEDVLSSLPARSSIDSSATPATLRYDPRYYDGLRTDSYDAPKTDSFESYDRDSSVAYDTITQGTMKDSSYPQTFNQQQSEPDLGTLPYLNHVDAAGSSWQPPAPLSSAVVPPPRSPVTIIDAQGPRQSFHVSPYHHESTPAVVDQRWTSPPPAVAYPDDHRGLSTTPVPVGYSDTSLVSTSSVEPTTIGYALTDATVAVATLIIYVTIFLSKIIRPKVNGNLMTF